MKKYIFGIVAVIIAVGALAFTTPHKTAKPYDTANYWYEFTGNQNETARKINTNYSNPQMSSFSCPNETDECAVQVTVTLDGQGNPPAHPDFTGASFEDGTGYPLVGGPIKDNMLKSF